MEMEAMKSKEPKTTLLGLPVIRQIKKMPIETKRLTMVNFLKRLTDTLSNFFMGISYPKTIFQ
jgi:hypothetical protein